MDIGHILSCENDQVTILLNVRTTQHITQTSYSYIICSDKECSYIAI